MAKQTKKQAPQGAPKTTKAGKTPAYSGTPEKAYGGKPTEKSKPYAGKQTAGNAYDAKTVDDIKSALYRVAEGHYSASNKEPLTDAQKTALRGGIDGVVDLLLLARKIDPQGMNGIGAVVASDAGQRYGIHSAEARHYLSEIAQKFAHEAELKPYEKPAETKSEGYSGAPGGGIYGGLTRDLGELLQRYVGRGPQPTSGPAPYANKGA